MRNYEYDYVITLKHPGYKWFNTMNHLLLLISALVLVYGGLHSAQAITHFLFAGAIAIVWAFIYWYYGKKKDHVVLYRFALVLAAVGWFFLPGNSGWIGFLLLLVALLEKQVKFPQEIGVDISGITFNSFPRKHHPWSSISNVVIKDGLITIDYKNNQLFQKPIEEEVEAGLETEFNSFCKQQLQENEPDVS